MSVFPKPIAVTKDTVLLSRKDWNAVMEALEDAEDRAAIRASVARRAAGKDDALPAELYKRLRAGEHPVRIWRAQRKMSLTTLAGRAGVARAYVSEIETGKKPGSVSALQKIARALGVGLDELAPERRAKSGSRRNLPLT
jgi:ribosome-binding protein aMBF1 (putative translation factor)